MKHQLLSFTALCQLFILPCSAITPAELQHEARLLGRKGDKKAANAKLDEALKMLDGQEKTAANLSRAASIHQTIAFYKPFGKEQLQAYQKARGIMKKACAKEPENQRHQITLATAMRLCADHVRRENKNDEALAEYAEAQKVLHAVTLDDRPSRPLAFDQWMLEVRVADTLNKVKKYAEALPHYEKALQLSQSLVDGNNQSDIWIESHATTYSSRGSCLMNLGQKKEALASYDQAIALMDQQIAKNPDNKTWKIKRSWYAKSRAAAVQKPISEQ